MFFFFVFSIFKFQTITKMKHDGIIVDFFSFKFHGSLGGLFSKNFVKKFINICIYDYTY